MFESMESCDPQTRDKKEPQMKDRPMIMVVDPDADYATKLSLLLDERGYTVVRRSFGIDALEYVAEDRPALVLSEVDLPDCDCDELLRSIQKISPATRVLFISRKDGRGRLPAGIEENMVRLPRLHRNSELLLKAVDRMFAKNH